MLDWQFDKLHFRPIFLSIHYELGESILSNFVYGM